MKKYREILKIVIIYAVFGAAWIYFSDTVLGWFVKDPAIMTKIAIFKGLMFIVATSVLLYFLIVRLSSKLQESMRALQESEERLHLLVKNSSDSLVIINADGRQRYVSPGAERITGFSVAELEGRTLQAIIHPDDMHAIMAAWNETVAHPEKTVTFQYRHIHKTRGWVFSEAIAQSFLDEPAINGIIASVRDITERKEAEEAISNSHKLLQTIMNTAPMSIFYKDRNLRYMGCNSAFANDAGVESPEELIGKDDLQLVWKEQAELYRADDRRVIESGMPKLAYVEPQTTPDGGLIWVRTSKVPLRNDANEIIGILGMYDNITATKWVEDEREKLQTLLEQTFEQSPVPMVLVSMPEAVFLIVNSACRDFLGMCGEPSVVGTSFHDFVPTYQDLDKDGNPCGIEDLPLARALRGETTVNEDRRIVRKDGSTRRQLVNAAPIYNARGEILAGYMIIIDNTERRLSEEARERLQEQLNQAQKMELVGLLAGGVAHDFNNMLSVIIGHAELAMTKMDHTKPPFSDLEEIRKAAHRSADITRQLLAFARKQTVAPQVVDLNEIIEGMFKMLRRLIGEDINLVWQPGTAVWPIKVDPSQIDQILANLCINAREAIAGVGRITVETKNSTIDEGYRAAHPDIAVGDYVRLTLSDTGSGMDKDTLAHIFEPFFTTKGLGKGTGLGLSTVYGAVKQNNGFINVYSELGNGTTFNLYFPRYCGDISRASVEIEGRSMVGGHETILLVEDEPRILKVARLILDQLGYTILAANSPGEASSLAGEFAGVIDLLVTDLVMPDMNGRDLAEHLLQGRPEMKVLFMSGYSEKIIADQGKLSEGVHFIQKPFTQKGLAAKVRDALDGERRSTS